jgi:hypothetical protein|tara:strand:+ start:923 stop:1273 length:351 start_codon:yes stop_codon:yes gene_type:complete
MEVNIMDKLHDEKSLWSDSDLEWELEEITREILTRMERQAVADGNIEIIHEPFKSKKKKDTKYSNTNGDTIRVFFDSDNGIERLKSIRAVTGFSLETTKRLINAFGYKILSFYDFR